MSITSIGKKCISFSPNLKFLNGFCNHQLNFAQCNTFGNVALKPNLNFLENYSYCNIYRSLNTINLKNVRLFTAFSNQIDYISPTILTVYQRRNIGLHHHMRPDPKTYKKHLQFMVHYPEDGKYTITPLKMTKLSGRDPETGRIIYGAIGGGDKKKYRWVLEDRQPPGCEDPFIEKVIHVQYDPNRSGKIALVGNGVNLRFIIATSNMKPGDIITSTRQIPTMAVRPKEGDAHPLGALETGTDVCCIERYPHSGSVFKKNALSSARVLKKENGKVFVRMDKYHHYILDENCQATIGFVAPRSKPMRPIGSAQRSIWLGYRPGSGLWQRKSGIHGRKTKYLKKLEIKPEEPPLPSITLTIPGEGPRRPVIPATNRVS